MQLQQAHQEREEREQSAEQAQDTLLQQEAQCLAQARHEACVAAAQAQAQAQQNHDDTSCGISSFVPARDLSLVALTEVYPPP